MAKTFLILLFLSIGYFLFFAEEEAVAILPDLEKPNDIKVDQERIYITEAARIFIYSKNDFSLMKKFGKSGKGPGEFVPGPRGRKQIYLDVQSTDLLVTSYERISFFSKNGEFKKQIGAASQTGNYCIIGQYLVGLNYYWEKKQRNTTEQLLLFKKKDPQYEPFERLYRTKPGGGSRLRLRISDKTDYNLIRHYFGFRVSENKVYIADTNKGYYIAVFDQQGKPITQINKDYEKAEVTGDHKEKHMKEFETSRMWKYREYLNLVFPKYFPAFQKFWVSKGKIFVYTYVEQDKKREIQILDQKGSEIKKILAPKAKYADVYDDKYFFLKQNKYDEWELHVVQL